MRHSAREAGHTYVIRLWFEPYEDRQPGARSGEYRGMVEHVTTGNRRYFRDADSLVDFMFSLLQPPGS